MASQLVKELDAASLIILAPPNQISSEQRHAAEEIFMNFRMTKMPYQLCRDILETSKMDFVLYESVRLIKSALIKEWKLLSSDDIDLLRNYLFHYNLNKPTLAPFVREQITQVIAIMVKRKSVEDDGAICNAVLNEIELMIINGDLQQQLLGCSLILALLQEYTMSTKTTDIGLTTDVHQTAKKTFEHSSSKRIFKFCVNALSELTKNEITETQLPLIKQLTIINRNAVFTSIKAQIIAITKATPSLYLDQSWKEIILDPTVIQLFFTLYWKIRTNLQIAHHARTCLRQLATLNGFDTKYRQERLQYLNEYLNGFIKLVSSINIIDQEAPGMAKIIHGILIYFDVELKSLSTELRASFIDQMMRLTHTCSEGASQEESLYADDCFYMRALEKMLDNWYSVLKHEYLCLEKDVEQYAAQVFNLYVKFRLSPPDGNRRISDKELTKEVVEFEENDREKYKYQLQLIGNIARKAVGHSLTLLIQLLESRATKLHHELSQVPTDPKCNLNISMNLENLYEDIHWLVLLSGHVLCMESRGEVAMIPAELIKHSIAQKKNDKLDPNMSLQLFVSPQSNLSEISANSKSFDHAIRLAAVVFRLAEIEKMAIKGNISYILSPELSSTIIWFFRRWTLNYLLPDEDIYHEMSPTFFHAFGGESIGAQWTIDFLLEKIHENITTFIGEEQLIKDVIKLFLALVKSKPKFPDKTLCVLKSDRLGQLIDLAIKNHLAFPQAAKRGLLCAIAIIGGALKNDDEERYWSQTIKLLVDRFNQVLSGNGSVPSPHQEDVKIQIIDLLDCFIGVAKGVETSTAHSIFRHVKPVLFLLPNLLTHYHHYQVIVQLILKFLYVCSRRMLNCLNEQEKNEFYQCCIQAIEAYARCNINRVSVDTTDEENTFQDIVVFMRLLRELLTTNSPTCSDLSGNGSEQNFNTSSADVFVAGLNVIMPMMTMELLKFPSLCNEYYQMISRLSTVNPNKICNLQGDLHRQLMNSIELGLVSFDSEITEICCHIIKNVAEHIAENISADQPNYQMMAPFMNLLMNLILSRRIDCNLVSNVGSTLFCLMYCYHEEFIKLVAEFLVAQPNPEIAGKWTSAFANLTADIQFPVHGQSVALMKFRKNFEEFIVNVLNLSAIQ
ncbi:hypothetical protein PV327_002668 [Microctonus hyperodae]|uniref:Exportin-4 n=1 Tax=Microctonus hyperodae TaxID=165561 RepID=A0AA39KPH7_MICHY|nr:hypothetical protein PV327_002668 [Microctonus hyperodae]